MFASFSMGVLHEFWNSLQGFGVSLNGLEVGNGFGGDDVTGV